MKTPVKLQCSAAYLVCGIVITIPLIFGAVHPIVLGSYVYLILAGLGTWLLLNHNGNAQWVSCWTVVPVILIAYLILQSIPIPLDLLDLLSPHRAQRVRTVNELAGTGVHYVTLSENGTFGFYRAFFLLAVMLYYFSVKRLINSRQNFQGVLIYCLVGIGAFEAVYGLIQFINPQIGILWLTNPARAAHGTIIYKNQYATMLNMLWPLAFATGAYHYINRQKRDSGKSLGQKLKKTADDFSTINLQAPLMVFAAGTMILATLFSLSRGGILAMILVGLLLLAILPFSRASKVGFLVIFICFISGYGALLGLDTIVSRFNTLDNSGAHRLDIYLSSLSMLKDHWLTGVGVGSFALLSPVFLKGFPAHILYDRVHNEYLELAIELGIPMAILLFGWMFAGMSRLLFGLLSWQKHQEISLERRVIGGAAFCGVVGFLVHGLADFGWRLPANLVYCMTLLAICACSLQPESEKISPKKETP